jgi:tetratricopeptide (TPR) repeat protein
VAKLQGHHPEAENHFRKATELNPDEPSYHYNLGQALSNQKRRSDAESEYRAALALKPDDYLARTGLGECLFEQKRNDEARTEFEAARALNEQDPEIHNWLGRVALAQSHYPEAENHFRKATELNPDESAYHQNLGAALSNQSRYPEAEVCFRKACQLEPKEPSYHFNLGGVLQELKRYEEAMQEYEECLLLAKQSTDAFFLRSSYHNIAWGLGKQGRFGKSLENWRKAILDYEAGAPEAARASDSSYFGTLGTIVYSVLGDLSKAAGWLEQGRKLDPDNVNILISLVQLYLEKCNDSVTGFTAQQRDERSRAYWSALDAYNRARKVFKKKLDEETPGTQKHAAAVMQLATLLEGMHEYEEARGLLADLLKREQATPIAGSSFTDALSKMGVVLMRLERFEEAAQYFERALRDDPDDLVQRSNLAEAYLKSKRLDKAETEYRKLLAITEDSVEALIGLGEVYTAMADSGESDLYDVAVDYFSRGRRTAQSKSRSKRLRRKEEAAVLYSLGYARVRWVETAKPQTGNQTLTDALDDFKQCCALDPEHYKAERAKKKIADWLGHSVPERVEKYGSSIIFCLSLLVFFGSQLGFYFAKPPAGKTYVGYWPLATFGSLLFMIAGLYLPQLLKIKVAGIELEKSSVDQVSAPVALGIARP